MDPKVQVLTAPYAWPYLEGIFPEKKALKKGLIYDRYLQSFSVPVAWPLFDGFWSIDPG